MHEVGILSAVLKTIRGIMAEEELTHVDKLVLEVGELSGVVPRYIEECFPAAVYKTEFEDLELEMIVIPGQVMCDDCQTEFNGYAHNLRCPQCESESLTPLSGTEFIIKEIHAR